MELKCGDASLSLDRVAVMGILNVTPDSFSDGGLWLEPETAVEHGLQMIEEGASIIDVGGESTRPGAEPVPEDEELRRVIPVIEELVSRGVSFISIDTRKPEVARRAIAAGASIVNDTLGEATDGVLDEIAAESGAAIVVMHSRGTPATMKSLTQYDDVVDHVVSFLEKRARELEEKGVHRGSIVIDPGIGFAKSATQSARLIGNLPALRDTGYPVLVGASRKSFFGHLLGLEDGQRLEATLATTAWAVANGASIVRVHDVRENVRVVQTVDLIAGTAD